MDFINKIISQIKALKTSIEFNRVIPASTVIDFENNEELYQNIGDKNLADDIILLQDTVPKLYENQKEGTFPFKNYQYDNIMKKIQSILDGLKKIYLLK